MSSRCLLKRPVRTCASSLLSETEGQARAFSLCLLHVPLSASVLLPWLSRSSHRAAMSVRRGEGRPSPEKGTGSAPGKLAKQPPGGEHLWPEQLETEVGAASPPAAAAHTCRVSEVVQKGRSNGHFPQGQASKARTARRCTVIRWNSAQLNCSLHIFSNQAGRCLSQHLETPGTAAWPGPASRLIAL